MPPSIWGVARGGSPLSAHTEGLWGPVLTAMITPFTPEGEVDHGGAVRLARHLVDHGSDGLVVGATTGEGAAMDPEERVALWETVLAAVGDRAAVWASAGTNDTRQSALLAARAEAMGCHGVMAVAPYYNRPSQAGLYRHLRTVAEAVGVPVMLYNVPKRTGVSLGAATVLQLVADVANVRGVKEASGDPGQIAALLCERPPELRVLAGDDALMMAFAALGGDGVVSVASNVAGEAVACLWRSVRRGEAAAAAAQFRRLWPLIEALSVATNPVPVKYVCARLGLPAGPLRLPLVPLEAAEAQRVETALRRVGEVLTATAEGEAGEIGLRAG